MSARPRRPLLVLVALAVATTTLLQGAAGAAGAAAADPPDAAFSDIAGCISSADNVLVSIVVDESLSLRETDPDNRRVEGIATAIDSLQALSDSLDETRVDVSLSTFARGFDTVVDWRRLDDASAAALREAARSELPQRDAGDATDYRQALQGARQELARRQRSLRDPDACQVVLWFTDGALDVDEDTGAAAEALCQQGGLVDALRREGIAVVALALFTPGAGVSESQREQLRSVAQGRGAGVRCGTVPIPPGSTAGIYLPADDPSALQGLFARAGALVAGGTPVESVTCPGPGCPDGRYDLTIDPGVAGARVLVAGRDGAEPDVRVQSPSGESLDLSSGSAEADGAEVRLISRSGFATIDVTYPRYAEEQSTWRVQPGPSRLSAYWFWGAGLDLGTDAVQAGEPTDLELQLTDRVGDPLDPGLYDELQVTARLGSRDLPVQVSSSGLVTGTMRTRTDGLPPTLPLAVRLTARSRPSGVRLGPLSLRQSLDVELPPVFPTLSPDELDFGALEGVGSATTVLRARGSELGATRVCFAGSAVTVPGTSVDGADLVSASRRCVRLDRGARGRIPLSMEVSTAADAATTGTVTLTLDPADGSAARQVEVPVTLEQSRIVDQSTRWLLVALLVGLAVLLPLLVLVAANWLSARFAMTSLSRIGTSPVTVTRSGLVPRAGGELIAADQFDNAGFSGRRRERRMRLGRTGITAETRGALGLRDAQGVALGPERTLLVSAMTPYRGETGQEAPIGLGDVDGTFVLVERTGTTHEAQGTLVMVVPGTVDNEGIHHRAGEASNRVDWERVLVEAAGPVATSDPAPAPTEADARPGSRPGASGGLDEEPAPGGSGSAAQEREPFPWESAAETRPAPPPPGRHSRGRSRRVTSDSEGTPDRRSGSAASSPRDRDTDGGTGNNRDHGDENDEGLPPLPDFLRED